MKIDGKLMAQAIYADLTERVGELTKSGVTPKLAVILMGDDPGSVNYVRQKEKNAEKIGVSLHIDRLSTAVTQEELQSLIEQYNADESVHGIIIQRPAPKQLVKGDLDRMVIPEKDVDGFHPNSDFAPPVALAVERILYEVFKQSHPGEATTSIGSHTKRDSTLPAHSSLSDAHPSASKTDRQVASPGTVRHLASLQNDDFFDWLLTQDIVVMGKGETAGMPIISHFHNRSAKVTVIDSSVENPNDITGIADIVISAVGKKDILTPDMISHNGTVIGVGLHVENGKLRGDYDDDAIGEKAAYYTTTPGGVGPVNVAMLLGNVVRAAEEQTGI